MKIRTSYTKIIFHLEEFMKLTHKNVFTYMTFSYLQTCKINMYSRAKKFNGNTSSPWIFIFTFMFTHSYVWAQTYYIYFANYLKCCHVIYDFSNRISFVWWVIFEMYIQTYIHKSAKWMSNNKKKYYFERKHETF